MPNGPPCSTSSVLCKRADKNPKDLFFSARLAVLRRSQTIIEFWPILFRAYNVVAVGLKRPLSNNIRRMSGEEIDVTPSNQWARLEVGRMLPGRTVVLVCAA